jgi:hypothetical protein
MSKKQSYLYEEHEKTKENLYFLNMQKGSLQHIYKNSEKVPVQNFYKIIHNFRFRILLELFKLLKRMKTRNVVSFLNFM